jgi:hypothetical protein
MKVDPFGNLTNWGAVLDIIYELADAGKLSECQPGLIRILRYKGNWQLREEVLKRAGEIQNPSYELIRQILNIVDDDNTYYDARILASDALIRIMKDIQDGFGGEIYMSVRKVAERLMATPHPPIFDNTLTKLYSEICLLER